MKHRLLLSVAAALLVVAGVAAALACDHADKSAAAQTKTASTSCAAHETAAVTAAVQAKASSGGCAAHEAAAAQAKSGSFSCAGHAAAHAGCPGMEGAAAASHHGCPYSGATAAEHVCSAHEMTAGESAGCCMGVPSQARSTSAPAARTRGVTAVTTGSSCSGHETTTAENGQKCDWCSDMTMCQEELRQIGVETQVVPLKNGVMVLYTATSPHGVEAVQASVARRGERLSAIVAAGDKAHLCSKCKEMRGAMASGKLVRETVNIEGGCLTVMTSDDPKVVAQIQSMSGMGSNGRSKT